MGRQQESWLAGEVQCINCGAVLAEVVRGGAEHRLGLRPARYQREVQAIIDGPRLRCKRCNGRALVELLDDPTEAVLAATRGKQYAIA